MPNKEGDEEFRSSGDRLTTILVHVGETRKGIARLEGDVKDIKDVLAKVVTTEDCNHVHDRLDRDVAGIQTELRELRKKPTGVSHQAVPATAASVSTPAPAPGGNSGAFPIPQQVEEVLERRQEHSRKSLSFWLATIGSLVSLFGAAVFGFTKLSQYLHRVDQAVEESTIKTELLREELRRDLEKRRAAPVIKAPAPPDAGTPPLTPATKRRKLAR